MRAPLSALSESGESSDQPLRTQADIILAANDDVIVQRNAESFAGIGDVAGDGDVLFTGRGIAAGMIVDQDDRRRSEIERAAYHFTDIDGGLVDRTIAHYLVTDQMVAAVEVEHAHPFIEAMRHLGAQIVQQPLPISQNGALVHFAMEDAHNASLNNLDRRCRCLAHAADTPQRFGIGADQRAYSAKLPQQRFGQGFGIASRNGEREQIFDQLMVRQGISADAEQPVPQPRTVSGAVVGVNIGDVAIVGHIQSCLACCSTRATAFGTLRATGGVAEQQWQSHTPRKHFPMRKRSAVALALTVSAAATAMVAWVNREAIVAGYVDDALTSRGVDARYQIDHIGFRSQRLTNVVIGDPGNPDLTARAIEVDLGIGLTGPYVAAVRVDGVHVRGRWTGDKLSFGELDRLIPEDDGEPPELPDIDLALRDASATIDSPWGQMALDAAGHGPLRAGFHGRVAVHAPQLAVGGCVLSASEAMLRIKVEDTIPKLSGPLGIGAVNCSNGAGRIKDVRIGMDANMPLSLEGSEATLRLRSGAARISGGTIASLDGEVHMSAHADGNYEAHWTVNGINPALSWGSVHALEWTGDAALGAAGDVQAHGALRLAGIRGGTPLRDALAAMRSGTAGTPVGPIIGQMTGAVGAASRGASATASYDFVRPHEGPMQMNMGNISVDAGSGAYIQIARPDALRWSPSVGARLALTGRFGGGGLPRGSFEMQTGGPSPVALSGEVRIAPIDHNGASLALTPVRFSSDGSGTRFATAALLSGPLGGGRVEGLSLPIDGRVGADGRVAIGSGCRTVGWQRIISGSLTLSAGIMPLCAQDGSPLFQYDHNGVTGKIAVPALSLNGHSGASPMTVQMGPAHIDLATMRFAMNNLGITIGAGEGATHLNAAAIEGSRDGAAMAGMIRRASGSIGSVPFLFSDADGEWRWNNGVGTLDAGLRITDAAVDDRFNPLSSDDTQITYRDGSVNVVGSLFEPSTRTRVANVTIDHRFADGNGSARFAIPAIAFVRGGIQPVLLTRLSLGVAADVIGEVVGSGRVDWNSTGVTSSSGDFATEAMDLAAAFGPVQRMSGRIHFSDLVGLATPPGQEVRLGSVNPGVEVTDGVLHYQLLPGQRVAVESGRWPFAGGELSLRPTLLDYSADVPRFLTFDVSGVDAALFLSRYEFDNITATGVFDGTLPTKFTADGGRVEGGVLQSRAGGSLAVVGELAQRDLGFFGNLAFGTLKSLRYDSLTINMNGRIDGEMLTEVRFAGLAQGEGADNSLITRAFRRLPIIFNIRINAPFQQLLTSARGLYDPTLVIGQNVDALVRAEREAAAAASANTAQGVQPVLSEPVP